MTWNKSYYKSEEAEELSVLKWHRKRKGSYPILRFWAQPAFCNMSHSSSLKVLGGWVVGRTLLMAEGGYPARVPFPRTQIMWFSIIFILLDQFLHLQGPYFHQLMKMTLRPSSRGLWFHAAGMKAELARPFVGCPQLFWNPRMVILCACRPVCPTSQPAKPVCAQWRKMNFPMAFLSSIQKVRSSLYYCTLKPKHKFGGLSSILS